MSGVLSLVSGEQHPGPWTLLFCEAIACARISDNNDADDCGLRVGSRKPDHL